MTLSSIDDIVAPFQINGEPVRGRIARLGPASVSPILQRHDYPAELARILGEATVLAALVGDSLKFEGRVLVQAEGDGPVAMMVAEYRTDGGMRSYASYDAARWDHLEKVNKGGRPHMPQLFGPKGALGLILIHDDPSMQPYQGVVPLMKASLAECAEDYFSQSEQVPTRIKLAVAELVVSGKAEGWRGGGLLLQRMAADETRGDPEEAWRAADALASTVADDELVDPGLLPQDLLFRLFHEQGVRLEPGQALVDSCTCNEDRLRGTLASMPDTALRELVEPDGTLAIACQFCNRTYSIPLEDVVEAPN